MIQFFCLNKDDCAQSQTCVSSYFAYDDAESGTKGIYGTSGSCVAKLLYEADCPSHYSCDETKGLQCSDYGCTCQLDNKYWNPVDQNCVVVADLCHSSDLVCGSCIKVFNTDKTFTDAEAYCVSETEFKHMIMPGNTIQWYYMNFHATQNDLYWV
jgi:hypothetical protein